MHLAAIWKQLQQDAKAPIETNRYLKHVVGFVHWLYIHGNFVAVHQENIELDIGREF